MEQIKNYKGINYYYTWNGNNHYCKFPDLQISIQMAKCNFDGFAEEYIETEILPYIGGNYV